MPLTLGSLLLNFLTSIGPKSDMASGVNVVHIEYAVGRGKPFSDERSHAMSANTCARKYTRLTVINSDRPTRMWSSAAVLCADSYSHS